MKDMEQRVDTTELGEPMMLNEENDVNPNAEAAGQREMPFYAHGYEPHSLYFCCDFYEKTDETWLKCPVCGLQPKKWTFDNGRSTGCGCGKSNYDHFSIHAESIMSVHKRTNGKGLDEYDSGELRKNWNHWCKTGKVLFEHASTRTDGRW